MKEEVARAILRLIAVVTILVGAILTTTTSISLVGASSALQDAVPRLQGRTSGMVAEMGFYMVLAHALIVVWGVVLYFFSRVLARHVVE